MTETRSNRSKLVVTVVAIGLGIALFADWMIGTTIVLVAVLLLNEGGG